MLYRSGRLHGSTASSKSLHLYLLVSAMLNVTNFTLLSNPNLNSHFFLCCVSWLCTWYGWRTVTYLFGEFC